MVLYTRIPGEDLRSGPAQGYKTFGPNLMRIEALLDTLEDITSRGIAARFVVLITWSFKDMPSSYGDVMNLVCKGPLSLMFVVHSRARDPGLPPYRSQSKPARHLDSRS